MAQSHQKYPLYRTVLPQSVWWSLRKDLARLQQHNVSKGLPRFAVYQGETRFHDFPGHHVRHPMVEVGVRAGPPSPSDEPEGRPLTQQWAKIESALEKAWGEDELLEMAQARPLFYHTESVLAAGAAISRIDGGQWRSRTETGEGNGSVDDVLALLNDPAVYELYVTDEDRDEARAALTYYRSPRFDPGRSEYRAQISDALADDAISIASVGLVASGINAWCRMGSPDAGGNQSPITDTPIGVPGDRIERQARVDKIIPMEGDYGINHLTLFQDCETGARLTWLNSGQQRFYEGDTYTIRGTVKAYEQRDTHAQTSITRVTSPDLRAHLKFDEIEQGKLDSSELTLEKMMGWFKGAASIDARDEQGRTALWRACDLHARTDAPYSEFIEFLAQGGADPTLEDQQGLAPADHLIVSGNDSLLLHSLLPEVEGFSGWLDTRMDHWSMALDDLISSRSGYNHPAP